MFFLWVIFISIISPISWTFSSERNCFITNAFSPKLVKGNKYILNYQQTGKVIKEMSKDWWLLIIHDHSWASVFIKKATASTRPCNGSFSSLADGKITEKLVARGSRPPLTLKFITLAAVFRIQIQIQIHMFLGLLDPNPDPIVKSMDPDPSSIQQN